MCIRDSLITAERGKRLNVLGALISNGTLFTAKFWETTTAAAFGGFLGLLLECSGKPLTVILDNASIHKAKEIQPLLALLKGKGLTLYFLPPYSPELNRIEKLWHKMKYEWMAFKARSAALLEADVTEILDGFGSKSVSYTHLRAHETVLDLVCRLLLEKKKH